MPPSKPIMVRVSAEIREAAEAHCRKHGVELSTLVRRLLCEEIGKPELAETMRAEGRPKRQKSD